MAELGKRYVCEATGVEIVVTKGGTATITCVNAKTGETFEFKLKEQRDLMAIPMGKRFEDTASGIQVLILKGNPGEEWQLQADGRPMEQVGAKPLPSSD